MEKKLKKKLKKMLLNEAEKGDASNNFSETSKQPQI
jgi:hypothetical protein